MRGPFEIRTVCPGERETDALVFGSGDRPLLVLPGLAVGSVLSQAAAVARAYRAFTEGFTVYLPDRRKRLPRNYTIWDMAADTAAVMDALALPAADIIGVSQGGMIAMCLALAAPARVTKLALCSTAARVVPQADAVLKDWMRLAEEGDAAALTASFYEKLFSPAALRAFGLMESAAGLPPLTPEERARFLTLAGAARGFDIRNRLEEIRCPALVLGAENDAVLTGEAVAETADLLGCARYLYPAPYGHGVYDEAGDFKTRLLRFLEG